MQATWSWTGSDVGIEQHELARDATLRVRPGRHGVTLRAERGTLHVTQAGDPDDYVIQPGEALWLPRGGLVVAWALTPARVVVAAGQERAHRLAVGAAAA